MKQDDARKLDHATLEAMRIRAVRSVQAGENPEVVARSLKDQSPDNIRMAGAISARWMGSVEGQTAVWQTAQTECARHAMGLHDGDAEESVATKICVCAVDARDGRQADPG